jgi:hypothetical protein
VVAAVQNEAQEVVPVEPVAAGRVTKVLQRRVQLTLAVVVAVRDIHQAILGLAVVAL